MSSQRDYYKAYDAYSTLVAHKLKVERALPLFRELAAQRFRELHWKKFWLAYGLIGLGVLFNALALVMTHVVVDKVSPYSGQVFVEVNPIQAGLQGFGSAGLTYLGYLFLISPAVLWVLLVGVLLFGFRSCVNMKEYYVLLFFSVLPVLVGWGFDALNDVVIYILM